MHWATRPYLVGVFHDDGVYALLARSIADGHGFHYSNLPGSPAATHYPPLYPLVLSAVWLLSPDFPRNIGALVALNTVLAAFQALGLWYFATTQLAWPRTRSAVVAVLCSLTLPTLALAGALLSETLFLAMLWPVLLLCESVRVNRVSWRRAVVVGAAIGALMLVRTHAVALLAVVLLLLVLQRRVATAATLAAASVAVQLPWLVWSAQAAPRVAAPLEGSYGSYLGWFMRGAREGGFGFLASTVRANVRECALLVSDRISAGFPSWAHLAVACVVGMSLAAGAVVFAKRAATTLAFLTAYLSIVLLWPYTPWRFIWAVWPLLLLIGVAGASVLWRESGRMKPLAAMALALPVLAMLRVELHAYATRGWREPAVLATEQIAPVIDWARSHTAPSDIVLSEGDAALALHAGRMVAPPISFTAGEYIESPTARQGADRLRAMLAAVPAQWVVLEAPATIQSAELLVQAHAGLQRAGEFRGGVAYRVVQ